MGKTSFSEFVKQEKKFDEQKKTVNWEEKKLLYLSRIQNLYETVRSFLHEYTESGEVKIEEDSIQIDEDYIGIYAVPVLHVHLYDRHAALVPAGTNMIGSPGRVDLVGDMDTLRIILADKNETCPKVFAAFSRTEEEKEQIEKKVEELVHRKRDYVWKIITDPPDIRYIELTEDSFLNSLQEVFGG